MKATAVLPLTLLLLSGCNGLSPDSTGNRTLELNGPDFAVGDTWQERGPGENFTYRVEEPVTIPYFSGNVTAIPLIASDRTLFLDSRTGLLLGLSINRQSQDFWHEGPGGWIGKPARGLGYLAYAFFAFAGRHIQEPLDFDFAIAPYTAEPDGDGLSLRVRGEVDGRPQGQVAVGRFEKAAEDTWKVSIARQTWTFSRTAKGAGPALSFDPAHQDSLDRLQETLRGDAIDEVLLSYGDWSFTQRAALKVAESSAQWPLHGPYTVLRASYSVSANSPVTTNESWSFELQEDGQPTGAIFTVTRLNLLGNPANESVSPFQATRSDHPCVGTDLPMPRTDPVLAGVQMQAAGYRVYHVQAELVERETRDPLWANLTFAGRAIPIKCDWFVEVYGDTSDSALPADPSADLIPQLHFAGWATGDGIVATVG